MESYLIKNYLMNAPLTGENSGFSMWGIGHRNGRSYFIKKFLTPVYPVDESMFSPESLAESIEECQKFVNNRIALYTAVRNAFDGNLIPVDEFFRVGSMYYIATEAVTDRLLSIPDIAAHPFADRLRLCCIIAHSFSRIHHNHIVHADVKPDNVLVLDTTPPRVKIIDFDAGFLESMCPEPGEELDCDLVYLSPEGLLHIINKPACLSCKMDVFALGLLFHQYLTGSMPKFDLENYHYAHEAILNGENIDVSAVVNPQCRSVISDMLQKDPGNRPDIDTVFHCLRSVLLSTLGRAAEAADTTFSPFLSDDETDFPVQPSEPDENSFFFTGGDLI